jgi:pimeloyl-ACP methyl ester carboxylesterase
MPVERTLAFETGRTSPHRIVFLCRGMFRDMGAPWPEKLGAELARHGVTAIEVDYFTEFTGVLTNWGSVEPARLVAEAADEISEAHETSGCARPLELTVLGFSHGGEVALRAARETRRARFARVVLVQSSSFAGSRESQSLIEEGRATEVVNVWSPLDVVTLFAPLGAGEFGAAGRDVRNERVWRYHSPRFDDAFCARLRELSAPADPGLAACPASDRIRDVLRKRVAVVRR